MNTATSPSKTTPVAARALVVDDSAVGRIADLESSRKRDSPLMLYSQCLTSAFTTSVFTACSASAPPSGLDALFDQIERRGLGEDLLLANGQKQRGRNKYLSLSETQTRTY